MGKKSRLRKERAEAEKADSSNRIAFEGLSSASDADADAGADSSSTRTSIIILPFSPSHASILGPAFSPDSPYTPKEDIFLGLDKGGEPRMVVKGSDVYEITKEPASDVYQFVQDPAKSEDIREASPEQYCTRPLNSSPPPSPPSTSAAGSSSPANKRSKKKAGDSSSSSISNDGSSPSKKGSARQ